MRYSMMHLNYVAVLVVAIAGFLVGWIWYGGLFGKAWMAEMKLDPEKMKEQCAKEGMAGTMIKGFLFTLVSTFGLAVLLASHGGGNGVPNWKHGAACGLFIGAFVSAARMLNGGVWEKRSCKLQAINAGHELVMYAIQGAILGLWH